jgi:hypothetical protein
MTIEMKVVGLDVCKECVPGPRCREKQFLQAALSISSSEFFPTTDSVFDRHRGYTVAALMGSS